MANEETPLTEQGKSACLDLQVTYYYTKLYDIIAVSLLS